MKLKGFGNMAVYAPEDFFEKMEADLKRESEEAEKNGKIIRFPDKKKMKES